MQEICTPWHRCNHGASIAAVVVVDVVVDVVVAMSRGEHMQERGSEATRNKSLAQAWALIVSRLCFVEKLAHMLSTRCLACWRVSRE